MIKVHPLTADRSKLIGIVQELKQKVGFVEASFCLFKSGYMPVLLERNLTREGQYKETYAVITLEGKIVHLCDTAKEAFQHIGQLP